jgi:TolB protein
MEPTPASAATHLGSKRWEWQSGGVAFGSVTASARGAAFGGRHTPRQCLARLIREALGGTQIITVQDPAMTARTAIPPIVAAMLFGLADAPETTCGWNVAFYSERNGRESIFICQSDGSCLRRLTDGICPSLSPDGEKILFLRDRSGGGIFLADVNDGTSQKLIDGPGTERHAAWSPDGSRIAFQSDRDGNPEIYTVDVGDSGWTRLTWNDGDDMRPSWSPDGSELAFNSNRDGNWEIYLVRADGSNLRRLTVSAANEFLPAWSPDGQLIAFRSGPPGQFQGDIHTIESDGSLETKLTDADGVEEDPAWSPDGNHVVFQSMIEGNFEIYVISRDGGPWRNISRHSAHDYWPACGPQSHGHQESRGNAESPSAEP